MSDEQKQPSELPRRIAACVNFCRGFKTDFLEAHSLKYAMLDPLIKVEPSDMLPPGTLDAEGFYK